MDITTVISLLLIVIGLVESQTQSQQTLCEANCGNQYFTKLSQGSLYNQAQISQEFNACRNQCKLTPNPQVVNQNTATAQCRSQCLAAYNNNQQPGSNTAVLLQLYNACVSRCPATTNNINVNTVAATQAQCQSTCLLNYQNQERFNLNTLQQRQAIYSSCLAQCQIQQSTTPIIQQSNQTPQCKACLSTYQAQAKLNQLTQQQRLTQYQACLKTYCPSTTTTPTGVNTAQCTTKCHTNFLQTANVLSQFQRNTNYNTCVQQCHATTTSQTTNKAQCQANCLNVYTAQTTQGLYTQTQRVSVYNTCVQKCDVTTTTTTTSSGKWTSCNDVCLTTYNNQRAANQGTQETRIAQYNTCKAKCSASSSGNTGTDSTRPAGTASSAKTKEGCQQRCLAQYETMQKSNTKDYSLRVYDACKVSCNSLPSDGTSKTGETGATDTTKTNTDLKAKCIDECGIQAARLDTTTDRRALVLTTCIKTCDAITAPKTTSRDEVIPEVPQEQCEWRCKDQRRIMRAEGKEGSEFIDKVFKVCNQRCVTISLKETGLMTEQCQSWALKLRKSYEREQSSSFLNTLQTRALSACN